MRTLLGLGLVLAMACGVTAADEKIDAKKLVGKWELTAEVKAKVVIEFTADGKMSSSITAGEKETKLEGTYKVDGNKIMQTMKAGKKEITRTVTVTKLTDDALETETEKGGKDTFKRVKAGK